MNKKIIISWLFSLILVAIIISTIEVEKVIHGILKIGLINFVFLSALYSVSFFFRALRWQSILYPITKISVKDSFFITNTGLFVNALLPARTGEFARAYLLSKKKNIGKIKSFSTVILDKIIDGLTLFLFFIAAVFLIEIPENIKKILLIPAIIFVIGFFFFLKPDKFKFIGKIFADLFPSFKRKIKYVFQETKEAGTVFYSEKKELLLILIYSVLIWVIESLVFYFTAQFMGIPLNLFQIFLLIVIVGFATMIPSAPSYVGTFEAGFVLFFIAFGLNQNSAISMGILIHLIQTIVIIIFGLISIQKLNISFKSISKINFNDIKNKIKGS